jgi:hypothetical protein
VIQLLVDANLDGHAKLLERRLNSAIWLEPQSHLDIHFINLDHWMKATTEEPGDCTYRDTFE